MLQSALFILALTVAPAATAASTDVHHDIVYQIFPRSFADGNGDGIGDLRGVLSKVDYLHDLGVNVVWLNPIFRSTHYDSGYDVTDYTDIDPQFGTLADFDALQSALHRRGMRLMLDLVLNHSSDEHPWFIHEQRVKRLQHALALLARDAPQEDGEQIIDMLADPAAATNEPTNVVQAARVLVHEFLNCDDHAAVAAGYPSKEEVLRAVARGLVPCVEERAACEAIAMPFDDFYIWREHTNNWTSIFSGPVWHAVDGTGGYYLALFSSHQIDLNWRNPRVRQAIEHVVRVWEQRGVDGMRLDSIGTLSKDATFPNAPPAPINSTGRGMQFYAHRAPVHPYLRELATTYAANFRTVGEVAFTLEHPNAALTYSGSNQQEMNEVFVFEHMGLDCNGNKWRTKPFEPLPFKRIIDSQQTMVARGAWLANYFENHDQLRIVSRYGDAGAYRVPSAKLFAALLLTLSGTPYIYQGQELGMTNLPEGTFKRVEDVEDLEARNYYAAQVEAGEPPSKVFREISHRCRDHVRSAMQWDDGPQAGFSPVATPVRVNPNYIAINASAAWRDPNSVLHAYQRLIALRREHPHWVDGAFADLLPDHPSVYVYERHGSSGTTWVVLNLSAEAQQIHVSRVPRSHVIWSNVSSPAPLATSMTLGPWEASIFDVDL